MNKRIREEFELLLRFYPKAVLEGSWVLVPNYPLPPCWSRSTVHTCFQIRDPYPGRSPYGIHVGDGLRYEGKMPQNYKEPTNHNPPFPGTWSIFSWECAVWQPGATAESGHNLLTYVRGFTARFKEGI